MTELAASWLDCVNCSFTAASHGALHCPWGNSLLLASLGDLEGLDLHSTKCAMAGSDGHLAALVWSALDAAAPLHACCLHVLHGRSRYPRCPQKDLEWRAQHEATSPCVATHLLQQRLGLSVVLKVVAHLNGWWTQGVGESREWACTSTACNAITAKARCAWPEHQSLPPRQRTGHNTAKTSRPRPHRLQDGVQVLGQRGLEVCRVQRAALVVGGQLLKGGVGPAGGGGGVVVGWKGQVPRRATQLELASASEQTQGRRGTPCRRCRNEKTNTAAAAASACVSAEVSEAWRHIAVREILAGSLTQIAGSLQAPDWRAPACHNCAAHLLPPLASARSTSNFSHQGSTMCCT